MKPWQIAALFGASLLMFSSGCSYSSFGFEDALRPPKTMGDEAEIEGLISGSAGGSYTLKYPKNGSYRSAIIMNDLDGDDVDEAVAFFKLKDDAASVRMLVMNESEGAWRVAGEFNTETTDVDCVDFADINPGDGLEIIVGYTTYSPNINFLSCYSYGDGKTETIQSGQNYSAFYCGNLDGRGKSEVITFSLYNADTEAKANMLEFSEAKNALYTKATAEMDPNVVKYRNVELSYFSNGVKGVVVDGSYADEQLSSQVIYYNTELALLRNPLYKGKDKSPTLRSSGILSRDIDNDQNIEIPLTAKLPYRGAENEALVADKLSWYCFNPEKEETELKKVMAANFGLNYTFRIPDEWADRTYTALNNSAERTMTFYEWTDSKLGALLFEIRVFDLEQWDLGRDIEDYSLIYRDSKYAYAMKNGSSNSAMALSDDKIKTSFSVLDGG